MTEPRLRLAVCGIYSLTIISIVVTIARAILLAIDPENSVKRILLLSDIELAVYIVIGVLPGVSSSFTRKYVQGRSGQSKSGRSNKGKNELHSNTSFPSGGIFEMRGGKEDEDIGTPQSSNRANGSATDVDEIASFTGSTDRIIQTSKGGITKVTDISISVNKQ